VVRVAVLRMEGTNCEMESLLAFSRLGAEAEYVHINEVERGRKHLEDYQILFFPGGFSAGDYVRAGAIFAARIKASFMRDLVKFVDEGKLIIGVCNGFQILTELGLLPAVDGAVSDEPQAALTTNDSTKFECRWVYVRNEDRGKCVFLRRYGEGEIIPLPVAHAEGKFVVRDENTLNKMIEEGQIAFRYVAPDGGKATYPWNPNGSVHDIAGICNPQGNVLGLMPHPERAFFRIQHPDWTRDTWEGDGAGKRIFQAAIEYAGRKL